MNSRTDKYYDEKTNIGSRTARNTNLYKEINKTELNNFELRSNATVIGNNRGSIDVEKIKSILDTHYNDVPRRKTIKIEETSQEEPTKPIFETKEYDINVILDKAKEEKIENYNEDRAKKIHNTQFDILNNLNINPKDYVEDYDGDSEKVDNNENSTSRKLEELINTITLNEKDIENKAKEKVNNNEIAIKETISDNAEADPLDIFADLKGSENTTILEGLQEKTENLIKQIEETTSLDNSFFTKSNNFKKSDFEDFKDIEGKETGIIAKIFISFLILAFIIGMVILVKSLFL